MNDKKLLCTGVGGAGVAAICCFTPALVILFGALGLSAWLAWADYVLLPALVLGTGIAAHAALRLVRRPAAAPGVER